MTDLVRKIAIEDKRRKDAEEKDEISIPIKKNSKAKAG